MSLSNSRKWLAMRVNNLQLTRPLPSWASKTSCTCQETRSCRPVSVKLSVSSLTLRLNMTETRRRSRRTPTQKTGLMPSHSILRHRLRVLVKLDASYLSVLAKYAILRTLAMWSSKISILTVPKSIQSMKSRASPSFYSNSSKFSRPYSKDAISTHTSFKRAPEITKMGFRRAANKWISTTISTS